MTTHNSINGGGRQFMADDEFPDLVQLTNTLLQKGQDIIISSTLQTTTQQHPPITTTVASSTINTESTTATTTLISSLIQSCTTTQQHLRHYLIDLPVNYVSHWLFATVDQVDGEMSNHSNNNNNNNNEEWISRIILVECLVLCIVLSLIVVAWRHYYPFIELLLQQRKPVADVDVGSEEQLSQQQQHDHITTSNTGEIETPN